MVSRAAHSAARLITGRLFLRVPPEPKTNKSVIAKHNPEPRGCSVWKSASLNNLAASLSAASRVAAFTYLRNSPRHRISKHDPPFSQVRAAVFRSPNATYSNTRDKNLTPLGEIALWAAFFLRAQPGLYWSKRLPEGFAPPHLRKQSAVALPPDGQRAPSGLPLAQISETRVSS